MHTYILLIVSCHSSFIVIYHVVMSFYMHMIIIMNKSHQVYDRFYDNLVYCINCISSKSLTLFYLDFAPSTHCSRSWLHL